MGTVLKSLGATVAALLAGCNPYAEGLKKTNAEERERNRTQTKAALVMEGVKAWSAAHGGALPSPTQFRSEVAPPRPPKNDWNFTQDEMREAKSAFEWTFPGGKPTDPKRVVGKLAGPTGGTRAFADGKVSREDLNRS